jgi:hypothetical protein
MEPASPASLASSLSFPIVAAAAGLLFGTSSHATERDLPVFGGLALIAALPLVASTLRSPQRSAAMLPLIDVANHQPGADSEIRFDPVADAFEWVVGPLRCVDESSRQLFVSYGDKTDAELLLNYGFLPRDDATGAAIPATVTRPEATDDAVREQLAATLRARTHSQSAAGT